MRVCSDVCDRSDVCDQKVVKLWGRSSSYSEESVLDPDVPVLIRCAAWNHVLHKHTNSIWTRETQHTHHGSGLDFRFLFNLTEPLQDSWPPKTDPGPQIQSFVITSLNSPADKWIFKEMSGNFFWIFKRRKMNSGDFADLLKLILLDFGRWWWIKFLLKTLKFLLISGDFLS